MFISSRWASSFPVRIASAPRRHSILPSSLLPLQHSSRLITSLDAAARAGTFFNQVPNDDGNGDGEDEDNDGEKKNELSSSLNGRNLPINALDPNAIRVVRGGKPGQGFGNVQADGMVRPKGQKPFVGIGPPLNDPTNPEVDEQGYTLYADERTGEKSRVFEALLDYPCTFTLKIVGATDAGRFVTDMLQIVADSCEVEDGATLNHSVRDTGKWTSVTVKAPVKSAEMLYQLYENVDRDPRVKFKF